MDDRIAFDINNALKHYLSDPCSIPTPEAPSILVDCEADPDALTPPTVNAALDPVVDAVAENPEAITRRENIDTLQFLLKCAPTQPYFPKSSATNVTSSNVTSQTKHPSTKTIAIENTVPDCPLVSLSRLSSTVPASSLGKILDLLTSALNAESDIANADIESDEDQEAIANHKHLLEIYCFLLQWAIACIETKATEKAASAPMRGRGAKGGAKKGPGGKKDAAWDPSAQIQKALDVMGKVLKLKLARVFVTTSERDAFISLSTRPVYLILENEMRVKSTPIKMHAFRVLCIAIKHHGHAFGNTYLDRFGSIR